MPMNDSCPEIQTPVPMNWEVTTLRQQLAQLEAEVEQLRRSEATLQQTNQALTAKLTQRTHGLQEQETWFRKLADNVPGMLYQFQLMPDGSMSFLYSSSGCQELLGVSANEICRNSEAAFSTVHPDDLPDLITAIQTSAQTLGTWNHEWRITTPDEQIRWMRATSRPERQADGSVLWYGYMLDVTDQKHTELALQYLTEKLEDRVEERTAALQQSQEQLQLVMAAAPIILSVLDRQGTITFCQGRGLATLGLRSDDVVGRNIADLYPDRPDILGPIPRALAGEEFNLIITEGAASFKTRYSPMQDETGEIVGMISVSIDISDRKQTEEKLRTSEARLRAVVSSAPVILFALDQQGRFTFSDGKALELLGLKSGEVVGQSVYELYQDAPTVLQFVDRALNGEDVNIAIEAAGISFESRYCPLLNDAGEITGMTGVAIDVTERKRAEEALREQEQLLRSTYEGVDHSICILDVLAADQLRYVGWNPTTERNTGILSAAIAGKSPEDVLGKQQASILYRNYP